MKFTSAFSVAVVALGVVAEPVVVGRGTPVERDVPAITNVLNAVGDKLNALDAAVKAFSGDLSAVNSAGEDLISTINTQAAAVPATGALSVSDAIGLTGPVQALQAVGQTLVSDLIAKKDAFAAARFCSDINKQSNGIQSSSQSLISAIVALVPTIVQPVAASLAQPFIDSLAQAVAAYAPGSCVDASGPPASTTTTTTEGGSSPSTTGAASSATSPAGSASASTSAAGSSTIKTTTSAGGYGSSPAPSNGASIPSSGSGPYATTTTKGAAAPTTVKPSVGFTGAADVNRVANSFGVIALAAAALIL